MPFAPRGARFTTASMPCPALRLPPSRLALFPWQSNSELPFWLEGQPKPSSQAAMKMTLFYLIQPDYLQVMRIPLKRGRFLSPQDSEHSPLVVVIDDTFARLAFGGQDPDWQAHQLRHPEHHSGNRRGGWARETVGSRRKPDDTCAGPVLFPACTDSRPFYATDRQAELRVTVRTQGSPWLRSARFAAPYPRSIASR